MVPAPGGRGESPEDAAAFTAHAEALADAVVAALPGWVERSVRARAAEAGVALDDAAAAAAATAGRRAADEVGGRVRQLLATDLDDQTTTPLALVRTAVAHPTAVLRDLGVPEVARDDFARRAFPADVYGLAPATLADLGPDVAEAGLVWGAAKAHVHLRRHR